MATEADVGLGIILKKASGEGFVDFGLELTQADVPGISVATPDATHMGSPGWAEMIVSRLKRSTPFSVTFNWVPDSTQDIVDAISDGMGEWQYLFPDGSTVTVEAAITELAISGLTPEGKMEATATFTPSGPVTWA